jgi:hypothetical protein
MSDAPRQPPPKKEVALALLEESSMFIHLDPRRPDVMVPKGFMGQPQLVLQVGLNMAIPIPDLKIDDVGISCTLSFNRAPFWCRIPWSAIYALVGEDGRGGVWAEDVPPEIQQQKQAAPSKAAASKKARPKLTAVGAEGRPADARRGEAGSDGAKSPLRAVAAADDGIVETEPVRAPLSLVPSEAAAPEATPSEPPAADELGGSPSEGGGGSPSAGSAGAKKPKREIPPYLRVIK